MLRCMDMLVDDLETRELASDVRDIRRLPPVEVARMRVEVGVLVGPDVVAPR
jgi:hypothetical protein